MPTLVKGRSTSSNLELLRETRSRIYSVRDTSSAQQLLHWNISFHTVINRLFTIDMSHNSWLPIRLTADWADFYWSLAPLIEITSTPALSPLPSPQPKAPPVRLRFWRGIVSADMAKSKQLGPLDAGKCYLPMSCKAIHLFPVARSFWFDLVIDGCKLSKASIIGSAKSSGCRCCCCCCILGDLFRSFCLYVCLKISPE